MRSSIKVSARRHGRRLVGLAALACPLAWAGAVSDPGDACVRDMARPSFDYRTPPPKTGDPRSGRLPEQVTAAWRQAHHEVLWPSGMYLRGNVRDWLLAGHFECLEIVHQDFLAADARFPDGQFKLASFLGGARDFVEFKRGMSADEIQALVAQWRAKYPQSVLAEVMGVRMLAAAAWQARGGGYAATVSPERWDAFQTMSQQAYQAARALPPPARDSFLGRYVLLRTMLDSGEPIERAQQTVLGWVRQYPNHFDLAAMVAERLLPKWHGTPEQLDRYIRAASQTAGPQLAARSYAYAYSRLLPGDALRTAPDLQYDLFRQGMQELAESGDFEHIVKLQEYACSFHDAAALRKSQALWQAYAKEPQLRRPGDDLDSMCRSWVATLPKV